MRRRRRCPPSPTRWSSVTSNPLTSTPHLLHPVLTAQVRHHGDQGASDGEPRLDRVVHRQDLELELPPEKVEPLRDPRHLAAAQLDVVAAGKEANQAPPEPMPVLEHLACRTFVGVE